MSAVLAGHREVWTSSHGWAGRIHVAIGDDGKETAACRSGRHYNLGVILLCDIQPAVEVPAAVRCRRSGCRERWPK